MLEHTLHTAAKGLPFCSVDSSRRLFEIDSQAIASIEARCEENPCNRAFAGVGMPIAQSLISAESRLMFTISPNVTEAFDKLQEMLLGLHVGDELRVSEAARASGLSEQVCQAMLEGLERAGLMAQADSDRFVRRRLDFI